MMLYAHRDGLVTVIGATHPAVAFSALRVVFLGEPGTVEHITPFQMMLTDEYDDFKIPPIKITHDDAAQQAEFDGRHSLIFLSMSRLRRWNSDMAHEIEMASELNTSTTLREKLGLPDQKPLKHSPPEQKLHGSLGEGHGSEDAMGRMDPVIQSLVQKLKTELPYDDPWKDIPYSRPWEDEFHDQCEEDQIASRRDIMSREFLFSAFDLTEHHTATVYIVPAVFFADHGCMTDRSLEIDHLLPEGFEERAPGCYVSTRMGLHGVLAILNRIGMREKDSFDQWVIANNP